MKVGLMLPQSPSDGDGGSWPEIERLARMADEGGADSLWVCDHFLHRGDGREEGYHEPFTLLTAIAAVTTRVEMGPLVAATSFRPVGMLAKMAGTLDEISQGRLILGLGCGWHEPEYEAFGFPFDHRVGRFEEDLEVTTRLLRGETVDFDGRWSHYKAAKLLPPPDRQPPILVASKGARMLDLTATWADAWNTAWFGAVDDVLRERVADLDAACARVGRDPDAIRRTVGIRVREPGEPADTGKSTDADIAGLADIFDEHAGLGFADAIIWSLAKTPAALERIGEARRIHLARRDAGLTAA